MERSTGQDRSEDSDEATAVGCLRHDSTVVVVGAVFVRAGARRNPASGAGSGDHLLLQLHPQVKMRMWQAQCKIKLA